MAKDPKKTVDQVQSTLEDHPPGMLGGKLNQVKEGDPPFEPEIVDELGRPVQRERGTEEDQDED
jgi:hypothetical protein